VVLLPALSPSPVARPAQPAAAATPVPTPAQDATQVAAPALQTSAAATLVSALATPTSPPSSPTPAATPTPQTLMDLRFATQPPAGWVQHPPYAGWTDRAYRFEAVDATRFVAVGVPINQVLSDVIVTATFRKTGGPPGGGYGLILRDQGPEPRDGVNQEAHAYVLEVGDQGQYGVWRRDGDHWVDLVPWTRSDAVHLGTSPNDVSARAIGDALTLTVNGTELVTVHDDTFPSGGIGLFVGGDSNAVELDHFSVQLPPQ
jgi:hypothetical protein